MGRKLAFKVYVVALAVCSLLAIGASLWSIASTSPPGTTALTEFALLIPVGWYFSTQRAYFTESSNLLLGTVVQVATILVLPIPLAVLASFAAKTASQAALQPRRHASTTKIVVNIGSTVVTVALSAVVFTLLGGPGLLWSTNTLKPALSLLALTVMAAAYLACDALFVPIAITLTTRDRLQDVVFKLTRRTLPANVSLIAVGVTLAALLHFSPVLSIFVAVPIYLSARSFAAVARVRDETERGVLRLAQGVDRRDTGTGIHSEQLEKSATRLATALGLIPEHVRDIGLAARTHDLGKIEIGDAILLKQGPLTPEERAIMERHAQIGSEMLESYSVFERARSFVRHHHERWDGGGYPDRLKGEDIPLGARIITVVDSYDAMVTDRPYRRGMSVQDAVSRLKAGMGTQFDPKVCGAWIQILIEDGAYAPVDPPQPLRVVKSETAV